MSFAEIAGFDVWRCEFCDKKVRKDRPHIIGMDGMRVHKPCVEAYVERERAADRREYREYLRAMRKRS